MRRKLIVVALILIMLVVGWIVFMPKVSQLLKPEVHIKTMVFEHVSEEKILANLDVVVKNPTKKSINTHRLDYTLSMKGEEIITENDRKPVQVLPGDSTLIKLPLKIDASKLKKVLREMEIEKEDSTEVKLTVTLTLQLPVAGLRQFHVVRSWRLPVILPIRLNVVDSDLESWRLRRSHVTIQTDIENQNAFPVKAKYVNVHMRVGKDLLWEANVDELVELKPRAATSVDFDMVIKNDEAIEAVFKSIFKDDKTPIAITLEGKIVSNDPKTDGARIVASRYGTLADLKKWRRKGSGNKD